MPEEVLREVEKVHDVDRIFFEIGSKGGKGAREITEDR